MPPTGDRALEAPPIPARRDEALTARVTEAFALPGVRAGSGLAWHGDRLVVVQDDALAVALVDPRTRAVTPFPLAGTGEALPKASKPDFEAVFEAADGRLVLIGSGSAPTRRRWARLDLATGDVALDDMGPLYDAVAAALGGPPNLEGVVRDGERLRLFHRADGAGHGRNVVLDVAPSPAPRVVATRFACLRRSPPIFTVPLLLSPCIGLAFCARAHASPGTCR